MGRKHSRKEKEKISKSMKKYYSNPAVRKKMSRLKKKQYRDRPELIAEIDRKITSWWKEHPHIRKERSVAVKRFFMKNPDKFKKFMQYGKNSSVLHLKTRQGFVVRSYGEQQIANFLFENKIKSAYEEKTLIFSDEGQICTPDFWLSSSKTYIEFYGGHPKSWKKKVMKNKLYKKHKIKCVFITPAELRNLEYFLMDELKK